MAEGYSPQGNGFEQVSLSKDEHYDILKTSHGKLSEGETTKGTSSLYGLLGLDYWTDL